MLTHLTNSGLRAHSASGAQKTPLVLTDSARSVMLCLLRGPAFCFLLQSRDAPF